MKGNEPFGLVLVGEFDLTFERSTKRGRDGRATGGDLHSQRAPTDQGGMKPLFRF